MIQNCLKFNELSAFGGFAHDPQGVLAAVHWLALVGIKLCLNIIALELSVASFADAESWMGLLYNPKFSFRHDSSLAHPAGRI